MNKIISLILAIILGSPALGWSQEPIKPESPSLQQAVPNSIAEPVIASEPVKASEPEKLIQPYTRASQGNTGEPAASDISIRKGEVLTLAKCIEIALRQQPSMLASMYLVDASQSRIGEAVSGYLPQVNLSGSAGRSKTLPTVGSPLQFISNQYAGTAQLTQLIYDFGKTPNQISIAQFNRDASRSDLDATRAQTILNAKTAYYGLLKAQKNLDVARETVAQYVQHLDQAKGFFEVGVKPKFDVTKAEVDLSNSQLNLITADNAMKIARATLNNAMGLPDAPDYKVEDSMTFTKQNPALSQAIDAAVQNRPEMIATERRLKASEETVSLASKGFFPVISGNAAYNRVSFSDPSFKYAGWNAGFSVTIPVFNGFLTYHQIREAQANYNAAKANYDLLKQNIVLEVQQAYLNLMAAADKVPTSELAVRQATENLEIANGRYTFGVGNPIEVTDAQVLYTNARTTYIQALYDYNTAMASLEKSMGLK